MPRGLNTIAPIEELPLWVEDLERAMLELEAWEEPPAEAGEWVLQKDREERAALEELISTLTTRLEHDALDTGEVYHRWLLRLRAKAETAKAEYQRVQRWSQVRERAFDKVKRRVADAVNLLGGRLSGSTWRLRTQKNGGVTPMQHDGTTPIDYWLAKDVAVAPERLVDAFALLTSRIPDHSLRAIGLEPGDTPVEDIMAFFQVKEQAFEPSMTRVLEWTKENGGVPPDGFTVGERGYHLRIE